MVTVNTVEVRRAKIVVVGAGPAGGACSLVLARSRRAEVVLVDKSRYPRVKVCGSGLSPHALRVLEQLELRGMLAPEHLHMAGITARGPSGRQVHLRGAKGAWVVPRVVLDHAIVRAARTAGAELREGTKVTALLRDGAGQACGVGTSQGEIEADLVICANGSPSRFEVDPTPRRGIRTIMGWWRGVRLPAPDEGVMIWDARLEGYYAWAFPEPRGVVNIGLTIPDDGAHAKRLRVLFRELLDEYFGAALTHAEPIGKWMGHPATVTTRVGRAIAEPRAVWCGEAARLVCPGTVEGIGFALQSGMLAAQHVLGFDPRTGLSAIRRARYRSSVARHMLPRFWAGEALHRLMRSGRARTLAAGVFDPQWLSEHAAWLVGESRAR
ncbi:NAD(P)/FAD-dependent oxidoreductase [Paraliomyxa miuraensis]|uniref:NAD(P)/FAD-dependent oxidoreductase n=1 Tax=Paraliomyxa miuraensis TaxID=376150 RepID=UPI0022543E76|nr:NAD(P)/FAD-dependent oxidoreductase [Paraliomyxa miuraensis]MCX4243725.1 NAD(P)/FAD-dependent oxidoreductase [Paraliomyxa miuraensis]